MAKHIYIHIPFCARKCAYCDFYSIADHRHVDEFFDAVKKEIADVRIVPDINPDKIDTVYFGGGTPSVPDPVLICDVLKLIKKRFSIGDDAEITIECNPASVDHVKLCKYKEAGFNRISLGIQSLHDDTLKTLGRLHDGKGALRAVDEARRAGFDNISADLMIGIPGQKKEDILEDAKILIGKGIRHISMYSLIIEEGTPFFDRYRHIEDHVDPDLERDMYHSLRSLLRENGLEPYEISNCGSRSVHNMSYWQGMEYYAFGPGASGYLEGVRFSHPKSVAAYIKDPFHTVTDEVITGEEKMKEYAMLMLRTSEGPSSAEFKRRFGKDLHSTFRKQIETLEDQGLIDSDDKGFRLTKKGLDLANLAFEEFI